MLNVVYVGCLIWGGASLVFFGAFAVHLYRSEGAPKTPAGGMTTPRTVPPVGPEQPDDAPIPPTKGVVRCRRTVPPSDPSSLGDTVSHGWRLK